MPLTHGDVAAKQEDTLDGSKDVFLYIYRYRTRGCLTRAYFFTLRVWGLEFSYLHCNLNEGNIRTFKPDELNSFPNLTLHAAVLLGCTRLTYEVFLSMIDSLSLRSLNHTYLSLTRFHATISASSSASRYVSRSSSIGRDLNITGSGSSPPMPPNRGANNNGNDNGNGLGSSDSLLASTPTQRTVIKELCMCLLNYKCDKLNRYPTRASLKHTYHNANVLDCAQDNSGFIAYIGGDNYMIIEPADLKILRSKQMPFTQSILAYFSGAIESLLTSLDVKLDDVNELYPAGKAFSDNMLELKKPCGNLSNTIISNTSRKSKTAIAASEILATKGLLNLRAGARDSVQSKLFFKNLFKKKIPEQFPPRQQSSCGQMALPGIDGRKKDKDKNSKHGMGTPPPPAPLSARRRNTRVKSPESVANSARSKDHAASEKVANSNDIAQKGSTGSNWMGVDDQDSDDNCLDELLNAQPYIPPITVNTSTLTSDSIESEESVDIIVDNISMSPSHFVPVIKPLDSNNTGLWGPTTAREMVHGIV